MGTIKEQAFVKLHFREEFQEQCTQDDIDLMFTKIQKHPEG